MKILFIVLGFVLFMLAIRLLLISIKRKTPWKNDESNFDVFVSYNTQSSVEARMIVDYLSANNIKVWFAEYMIPLNLQYNEKQFRTRYINGIKNSRLCIIIKNKYYSGSDYCREEYAIICKSHNTSETITINMDDVGNKVPDENTVNYEYNLEVLFGLLSGKLKKKLILPESHLSFFQGDFIDLIQISHLFQFERTDWIETNKSTTRLKVDKYDSVGPILVRNINGVYVELKYSVGRDSGSSGRYLKDKSFVDDKEFRKELIEFANKHFSKRGHLKQTGIHLLFLDEKSHMIFTYFNRNCWIRRYSIIDSYPKWPEKNFEFIFYFSIYGSFKNYCGIAPYLDRMVRTLNFYPLN